SAAPAGHGPPAGLSHGRPRIVWSCHSMSFNPRDGETGGRRRADDGRQTADGSPGRLPSAVCRRPSSIRRTRAQRVLLPVVLLGGLLLAGCGGKKPVATINGIPVSEEEFGDRCANVVQDQPSQQAVGLSVLGSLISVKVIEKEVRRLNLMPTDADVERRF